MDYTFVPVNSSNIESVGYNEESQSLMVKFRSGSSYAYDGIPQSVYDAFMASDSKGRFFSAYIRGKYPTTQL